MAIRSLLPAALTACMAMLPNGGFAQGAPETIRFGWCTNSVGISMTPIAAALKFGWFEEEGIRVDIVHIATGTDCARFAASGEVDIAAPAIEATAALIARGADLTTYFTIQQVTSWSIQAPAASNIRTVADLKGKRIGVISLSAVGATIVKGLARAEGLNPDTDIKLIAIGDAQRAAHFLQAGEIDAVSIFTLAHLQIEALGIPLRQVEAKQIEQAPSIGLVTTKDYLAGHKDRAAGFARAYAKGLAFYFSAPERASDVLYESFPQAAPAPAVEEGVRASNLALSLYHATAPSPLHGNLPAWGYSRPDVYDSYLASLYDWQMIASSLKASDVIDNSLIETINNFDVDAIVKLAREPAASR